jgi:hypothetical protein
LESRGALDLGGREAHQLVAREHENHLQDSPLGLAAFLLLHFFSLPKNPNYRGFQPGFES